MAWTTSEGSPTPLRRRARTPEIFPLVNNYDPIKGIFLPSIGDFLSNPASRAHFVQQVDQFLAANPSYRGISLDFEEIPDEAQPGYMALLAALYQDFQPRNLKLYVNTPVGDDAFDLKYMADHSDGLLLMNYDQHQMGSGPGPIAAAGLVPRQPEGRAEDRAQGEGDLRSGQLWLRLDDVAAARAAQAGRARRFVPKVLARRGDVDPGRMAGRATMPRRRSSSIPTRSTSTSPTTTTTRTSATRCGSSTR